MKQKIFIVFALIYMVGAILYAGYNDTHYSIEATVYSNENNEVQLVDAANYVWSMKDRPDLMVGSNVKIKFFNNTTEYTRKDDKIVGIKVLP